MIPGPIEFEPKVLQAMATPTDSHVSPDFIETLKKGGNDNTSLDQAQIKPMIAMLITTRFAEFQLPENSTIELTIMGPIV